ncbi:murein hydrolase activator EnvC family protein [Bordetella sp. 02P26C-1]|uniref:murein hydrolase activator EnvC family protein n=1 Tax=Bordetella sp. 02P26C-1 TaxID=2683195 RepID=UPI0013547C55|nr:peptidoglycan DD-metalloendopeptidase family protein [Bordetella sp. 02P26C-1]MVW79328.1 peptidoglycan DD-metalloendopeptidase family protein [Bordetella sp. 02P26C-1]
MRWMAGLLLAMVVGSAPLPGIAAPSDLAIRQSEAERQQAALRDRIDALHKSLEDREAARSEAVDSLKASELSISRINRRLRELQAEQDRAEDDLLSLEKQIQSQQQALQQRRSELSDQLRTQYASGLSPWTALLSGDDPQQLGRNLGYLGYVSRARAEAVQSLRADLERLASLQQRAESRRADLARTVEETSKQKTELVKQQSEHATLVAELEGQIAAQRAEARKLGRDDSRLSTLIVDLEKAIAEQAAAAKRAEEARLRAEAVRRAEQARLAEEARIKAEAERQAAAARAAAAAKAQAEAERAALAAKTEQARAAAQAEREKAERAAALAREQVEAAREQERQARARGNVALGDFGDLRPVSSGEVRTAPTPAPAATSSASSTRTSPSRATAADDDARSETSAGDTEAERRPPPVARSAPPPPVTGGGLRHGMTPPVRGAVQGRFGVDRPDGGVWRGIVLRTSAGTPVKAVAPGTVVYANWLRGFGNLIIIDHGKQYMTVYAYNQSLLKQVGDSIAAGDTIATVGSTGGQVESGLYFEIRYRGTPVDPTQWLAL